MGSQKGRAMGEGSGRGVGSPLGDLGVGEGSQEPSDLPRGTSCLLLAYLSIQGPSLALKPKVGGMNTPNWGQPQGRGAITIKW